MVFNTLNKTFSLQNLCAALCCFSLRWSAPSFSGVCGKQHMQLFFSEQCCKWSAIFEITRSLPEVFGPRVHTGRGRRGRPGLPLPSQASGSALLPCSCSPGRPAPGLELALNCLILAARMCSNSGITGTQNVPGLWSAGVEWPCHLVRLPAFKMGGHAQGWGWLWTELLVLFPGLLGGHFPASPEQRWQCSLTRSRSCHHFID